MVVICGLKVENLSVPMGIGADRPRFSWRTESDIPNFVQESYRIRVFENELCVWDSGKVDSPESLNITGCSRLRACTRGISYTGGA